MMQSDEYMHSISLHGFCRYLEMIQRLCEDVCRLDKHYAVFGEDLKGSLEVPE